MPVWQREFVLQPLQRLCCYACSPLMSFVVLCAWGCSSYGSFVAVLCFCVFCIVHVWSKRVAV